jgi:hypothetical protein
VWAAVIKALGGATGVELAGELAEMLPEVASGHGLAPDRPAVLLVEAGPTILAGSSLQLIDNATRILSDLGVQVRTNAMVAAATEEGFRLKGGQLVEGGVFVWAGGVKAPELVVGSGLPIGHNGRVKVDRYLRVLDHPEVYVAGDLASVVDPRSGHVLPPLAQVALEEGETVARNLDAELEGRPLEAFTFHDKGFVVSVGTRRGVADIAGITSGGRLAHLLTDFIEWEYRQSVTHLRGWDPVARDRCSASGFGAELRPGWFRGHTRDRHSPTKPTAAGVLPAPRETSRRLSSQGRALSGATGSYAECPDLYGRRSTCGRTDRRFMRGLRCRTLILVASIQATEGLAVCGLTRSGFRPVGLWAYRIGQFSILLMVIFSDSRQSRCLVAPSSRFPPSTRNGRHRSRHSAHNYE